MRVDYYNPVTRLFLVNSSVNSVTVRFESVRVNYNNRLLTDRDFDYNKLVYIFAKDTVRIAHLSFLDLPNNIRVDNIAIVQLL